MVIKTGTCAFSEMRIWPGHGSQFVRKDSRMVIFADSRSSRFYHNGKKAARLRWTQTWRRMHKKVRVETVQKRARKRRVRLQKPVQGLSLDELRKRRDQNPELRKAQREAAVKEIRERKKKEQEAKKKAKKATAAAPQPKMKFSKKGQR